MKLNLDAELNAESNAERNCTYTLFIEVKFQSDNVIVTDNLIPITGIINCNLLFKSRLQI